METIICSYNDECTQNAAEILKNGGVVGIPTETVYGLAANAYDAAAVEGIFRAKGRPQDNPLIVHIADMDMLGAVVRQVPAGAQKLAGAFWPGPLTLVLPKAHTLAANVSAGLDTVGVRMPAHPAARAVIAACGFALAAPSANLSGSPSPTTAQHVLDDLGGRIPLIVDGGPCPVGVESTVLTLVGAPTVLRPGFVTPAELAAVLGCEVAVAPNVAHRRGSGYRPPSPGMKYRHYAPKAKITIVSADIDKYIAHIEKMADNDAGVYALCHEDDPLPARLPRVTYGTSGDETSQAAALFAALRRLDELGAVQVYARCPRGEDVGLAVRNRLLRAADFREICL